jgi:hypothetical protein
LLGASTHRFADAERWVHIAGGGWLVLCLGMVIQAFTGNPLLQFTPALVLSLVGVLAWAAALVYAVHARWLAAPSLA